MRKEKRIRGIVITKHTVKNQRDEEMMAIAQLIYYGGKRREKKANRHVNGSVKQEIFDSLTSSSEEMQDEYRRK